MSRKTECEILYGPTCRRGRPMVKILIYIYGPEEIRTFQRILPSNGPGDFGQTGRDYKQTMVALFPDWRPWW
mgnify:CR=1 FL=1